MKKITSLEELKTIELNIMKHIHSFCESNDIKYFLAYGTLIGAIRHKGFIPWDDDIDLHMERKDYDRFCKEFPLSCEKLGLKLVNAHTPSFYGRDMAKVIDIRTVIYEQDFIGDDPIGVFVDVWPLDSLPEEKTKRELFMRHNLYLQKLYYLRIANRDSITPHKRILQSLIVGIDPRRLLSHIERFHRKYNGSTSHYLSCLSDPYIKVFTRSCFVESQIGKFEGCDFYIPNGYDEILQKIYGDYLQLPPVDKRIPHHVIETYWMDNYEDSTKQNI